jgi:hypothetical protein
MKCRPEPTGTKAKYETIEKIIQHNLVISDGDAITIKPQLLDGDDKISSCRLQSVQSFTYGIFVFKVTE